MVMWCDGAGKKTVLGRAKIISAYVVSVLWFLFTLR